MLSRVRVFGLALFFFTIDIVDVKSDKRYDGDYPGVAPLDIGGPDPIPTRKPTIGEDDSPPGPAPLSIGFEPTAKPFTPFQVDTPFPTPIPTPNPTPKPNPTPDPTPEVAEPEPTRASSPTTEKEPTPEPTPCRDGSEYEFRCGRTWVDGLRYCEYCVGDDMICPDGWTCYQYCEPYLCENGQPPGCEYCVCGYDFNDAAQSNCETECVYSDDECPEDQSCYNLEEPC